MSVFGDPAGMLTARPTRPAVRSWQRGFFFALLLGALLIGASVYLAAQHNNVHVLNGLPFPIMAQAGKLEAVEVPAMGMVTLDVPKGKLPFKAQARGKKIDEAEINVTSGTDVIAWNVLGASPLTRLPIVYGDTSNAHEQREYFCGQSVVVLETVDYPFEDPPGTVKLAKNQKTATRNEVKLLDGGVYACIAYLLENRSLESVALAFKLLDLTDSAMPTVLALVDVVGDDHALPLVEYALAAHPTSLAHHLTFAQLFERLGRWDDLRKHYQTPKNKAETYVVARLELYDAYWDWQPAKVLATAKTLAEIDSSLPGIPATFIGEAAVLVKRAPDALLLLDGAIASTKQARRDEVATIYALVARQIPSAESGKLLEEISAAPIVRLRAGQLPTPASIAELGEDDRARYELQHAALFDPAKAFSLLDQDPPAESLSAWSQLLLYLEGERIKEADDVLAQAPTNGIAPAAIEAARVFAATGQGDLELFGSQARAAAYFARARALQGKERDAFIEKAKRADILGGEITFAIDHWH